MTETAAGKGFSSVHIERLREKLGEWGDPSTSTEGKEAFIDLWFVDADVLSTYINSTVRDYFSDWPSLFALGPPEDAPKRGAQISEDAKELIDSIAIAVSYFLFGRFRETLAVQSRRFLLTPEHDRELDAMAIAVSFEAQRNAPDLMSKLTAHYTALAKAESVADSSDHISQIFSLLRGGSPTSKVSRALDLRQRLLDTMQDTAFFPSNEPGAAFSFRFTGNNLEARVIELAQEAFEIFLDSLIKRHPAVKRYAFVKRAVFVFHAPNRRLREYVDEVLLQARKRLAGDNSISRQRSDEFDERTLINHARIAARQVSDVYAIARLVALAELLNQNHPIGVRKWRVKLLTGSNMQRELREQWLQRNATVGLVRIIHPLSTMGIDGFAQPEVEGSDQDASMQREESGGYALRTLKQKSPGEIDVETFLRDFRGFLSSAAVSCAPARERWMRNLRIKLGGLDQHSRGIYLKGMRDAISRDFVSTFDGLNKSLPNAKGQLPSVSLPALALPLEASDPSPAQLFVMQLHGESGKTRMSLGSLRRPSSKRRSIPLVSKLIKSDRSGYSALLCIGLGYLAQGQDSLRLAEAVANTAVAFVSTSVGGDGEEDSYPEGNEALYFAAFVSRMQVSGSATMRSQANDWLLRHRTLLNRALAILERWKISDIGRRPVATPKWSQRSRATLGQLVHLRYEAECLAADAFGHLIDRLEIADPKLVVKSPIECMVVAKGLAMRWDELNNLDLQPQYRADVAFVGAQLVAAIIQAWLCVLADSAATPNEELDRNVKFHESWISEWINSKTFRNAAPGSMLVRVLIEIFNLRTRGVRPQRAQMREAERQLNQMQFAALDELRGPLFGRLLAHPETSVSVLFRGTA